MTVKFLWLLLGAGFIFGAIALATWSIPAPTVEVTKVFALSDFLQKNQSGSAY